MLSVVGRGCILEMEDYVKSRPTQYSEENVHICENVYDESRRLIRSLPPTGLKRYEYNSTLVVADEVYYFKRNYKPSKETSAVQLPVVQGAGNNFYIIFSTYINLAHFHLFKYLRYNNAVEGLGTPYNLIKWHVHDFLPNRMIFFHLSSTWFSDL